MPHRHNLRIHQPIQLIDARGYLRFVRRGILRRVSRLGRRNPVNQPHQRTLPRRADFQMRMLSTVGLTRAKVNPETDLGRCPIN